MKTKILSLLAVIAFATGCAEMRKSAGAGNENDHDVLTGGPVTGTTIKDLPQPVKDTLKLRVPAGEIADIDKETKDGRVIYKISFVQPGRNPTMCIDADGAIVQGMNNNNVRTQSDTK